MHLLPNAPSAKDAGCVFVPADPPPPPLPGLLFVPLLCLGRHEDFPSPPFVQNNSTPLEFLALVGPLASHIKPSTTLVASEPVFAVDEGEALGVADALGLGDADGVADALGLGDAYGVADALGLGDADGVGVDVGLTTTFTPFDQTFLLPLLMQV